MTDQTLANTVNTEDTATNNQVEKTFTQDEVNAILAKTKTQLEKKFTSKFEDLGDPDELRNIVTNYRKQQEESDIKKGHFDKIVQDLAQRKDAEIQKRDKIIEEFKLNSPIIDAAARYRAVNAAQVKDLVRGQVRLNADGDVEVLDSTGKVKYDDAGQPYTVDGLIQDFLVSNPHFVAATPSTTASRSSVGVNGAQTVDISKLDMRNAEHRKIYSESRKTR